MHISACSEQNPRLIGLFLSFVLLWEIERFSFMVPHCHGPNAQAVSWEMVLMEHLSHQGSAVYSGTPVCLHRDLSLVALRLHINPFFFSFYPFSFFTICFLLLCPYRKWIYYILGTMVVLHALVMCKTDMPLLAWNIYSTCVEGGLVKVFQRIGSNRMERVSERNRYLEIDLYDSGDR